MNRLFRSFLFLAAIYNPTYGVDDIQLIKIRENNADLSRLHSLFDRLRQEPEERQKYINLGSKRTLNEFKKYMTQAQGEYNNKEYTEAQQL